MYNSITAALLATTTPLRQLLANSQTL